VKLAIGQMVFPTFREWVGRGVERARGAVALTPGKRREIRMKIKAHDYAAERLRRYLAHSEAPRVEVPRGDVKPVAGTTAEAVVRRKLRAGISDLQFLVLVALAKREMLTLSDLAEELGVGASTAWHAAGKLVELGEVEKDSLNKPFQVAFFFLSDAGKRRLAWLLGKVESYE